MTLEVEMANPPVPIERKRARGNPGKRALPKVSETMALEPLAVEPPVDLGDAGREMWAKMKTAAPWLAESDLPTMMLLAQKADRRAEMVALLEHEPMVLVAEKTGFHYAHPAVGMLSTIETDMVKLMSLLGLTPTDRTRLGLAEVKAQSTLEKLRVARDSRG